MKKVLSLLAILLTVLMVFLSSVSAVQASSLPTNQVVWQCRKCETYNIKKFCVQCGEVSNFPLCTNCGDIVTGNYCGTCGAKVPQSLEIHFVINDKSMDSTLFNYNDEVLAIVYNDNSPVRGDVVLCAYPGRENTIFMKRVVAIGGDIVSMKDGFLYVNGEKQQEDYILYSPNYNMKDYAVPEGMYFVLGDNRANSNDSHLIGPLSRDMIIARVVKNITAEIDFK